jgi:alpha-galactosidase
MGIVYLEDSKVFQIHTKNTTYMMGVYAGEHLQHLYYGKKLTDTNCGYLFPRKETPEAFHANKRGGVDFFNTMPFEYPVFGTGDFRGTALTVRSSGGYRVCRLRYESHKVLEGKPEIPGMPATFGDNAHTLEVCMRDTLLNLKVLLRYSIFEDSDAILRSTTVVNEGTETLYLEKVMSACLDMTNENYDITTLHGAWARERNLLKRHIAPGKFIVDSVAGRTSHENHPFLMVTAPGATQKQGEVYGINLVYSGNFLGCTELNHFDDLRLTLGINPEGFEWPLNPGERFDTPEAVLVYSSEGIGPMTRTFHDLYRNHLIRSVHLHKERPILINNWEATYFNFDEEKLVNIAREAKTVGIEMLVMDDGWFGRRNNDETSLGDWFVDTKKLPGGLKQLVDRINAEGMKFGIWVEPEMVSPDSELYRQHPDWAIQMPGREITMGRHQYVLDLTRQDVRDYLFDSIASILCGANIVYVKWDMNRSLADIGSAQLSPECMGQFYHRYVLGLYELQERLVKAFPDLLLENCTSGGGRFDPGMLYYSPQIWTSDNMDPIQRLLIQEGTALIYPLSTMGAHVCVANNHCNGRVTPLHTRAHVAMAGTFGFELDITKMSQEEREKCAEFNDIHRKYSHINREGDYYRIASVRENGMYDCWQVVSQNREEFLLTYVQVRYESKSKRLRLRLEGLEPNALYRLSGTEEVYSGDALMKAGYAMDMLWGDYNSTLLHFEKLPQ